MVVDETPLANLPEHGDQGLTEAFDGVVMLTWSNWHTEGRKNRYFYATRFARHLPVLFVQPSQDGETPFRVEASEVPGVELVWVYSTPNGAWMQRLRDEMARRGIRRPLLWMYNIHFLDFLVHTWAPLKVYHATEDYFKLEVYSFTWRERLLLERSLKHVDLVVYCAPGVRDSYRAATTFRAHELLLLNGCDASFFKPTAEELQATPPARPVALFQGQLQRKVDFDLLEELARLLPAWDLVLCGEVTECQERLDALTRLPQVRYLGRLPLDAVRRLSIEATVGLIPYVQEPYITESSLPLKAYEYVASGLPVVTVPIRALEGRPDLFRVARTAAEFAQQMQACLAHRQDAARLEACWQAAAAESYDSRFGVLCELLAQRASWRSPLRSPMRLLVVYDAAACADPGRQPWLEELERGSRHVVTFCRREGLFDLPALERFDAALVLDVMALEDARWSGYGGFVAALVTEASQMQRLGSISQRVHLALFEADVLFPALTFPGSPDLPASLSQALPKPLVGEVQAIPAEPIPGEPGPGGLISGIPYGVQRPATMERALWCDTVLEHYVGTRTEETGWMGNAGLGLVTPDQIYASGGEVAVTALGLPFALPAQADGVRVETEKTLRKRFRRLSTGQVVQLLPLMQTLETRVFTPFRTWWETRRQGPPQA